MEAWGAVIWMSDLQSRGSILGCIVRLCSALLRNSLGQVVDTVVPIASEALASRVQVRQVRQYLGSWWSRSRWSSSLEVQRY